MLISHLRWLLETHQYLTKLVSTTVLLLDPRIEQSIKIESMQFKVLEQLLSCEGKTIIETIENLKNFASICRRLSLYDGTKYDEDMDWVSSIEDHPLRNCPRRWLAQIGYLTRALPRVPEYLLQRSFDQWKSALKPSNRELDDLLRNLDIPAPVKSKFTPPQVSAFIKHSGSLVKSGATGGALSWFNCEIEPSKNIEQEIMMRESFQIDLLNQSVERLMWFEHDCDHNKRVVLKFFGRNEVAYRECSQPEKHLPLAHMVVKDRGFKDRHLTMDIPEMQLAASYLQKFLTQCARHFENSADSFYPETMWWTLQRMVNKAYRSAGKRDLYFHSGDFTNCTDNIPVGNNLPAVENMIDMYDITVPEKARLAWIASMALSMRRIVEMKNAPSWREAPGKTFDDFLLWNNENTESREWFLQRSGQHMSNPVSAPIMAYMHRSATALVTEEEYRVNQKHDAKFRVMKQLWKKRDSKGFSYLVLFLKDNGEFVEHSVAQYEHAVKVMNVYLEDRQKDYHFRFQQVVGKQRVPITSFKNTPKVKLYKPVEWKKTIYTHLVVNKPDHYELWNQRFENWPHESTCTNVEYKESPPIKTWGIVHEKWSSLAKKPLHWELLIFRLQFFEIPEFEVSDDLMWVHLNRSRNIIKWDLPIPFKKDQVLFLISLTFRVKVMNTEEGIFDILQIRERDKNIFTVTSGDDHLSVSKEHKFIMTYKGYMRRQWNQKYSKKGEITSKKGGLFTEKSFIYDGEGNIIPVLAVKLKILLKEVEEAHKWPLVHPHLDRLLRKEFDAPNVNKDLLEKLILKARVLAFRNHEGTYRHLYETGLDPRLPTEIGGLNCYWFNAPITDFTLGYLKLLSYLYEVNHERFLILLRHVKNCCGMMETEFDEEGRRIIPGISITKILEINGGPFKVNYDDAYDILVSTYSWRLISVKRNYKKLDIKAQWFEQKGWIKLYMTQFPDHEYWRAWDIHEYRQKSTEKSKRQIGVNQLLYQMVIYGRNYHDYLKQRMILAKATMSVATADISSNLKAGKQYLLKENIEESLHNWDTLLESIDPERVNYRFTNPTSVRLGIGTD